MKLLLLAEGAPPEWMWPHMLTVVIGILGILMIVSLVLGAVEKWRKVFGPHPQIPQPPFETREAVEFATVGQVIELRSDMHNQLKDMRAYMHETQHSNANELQALQNKLEAVKDQMSAEGSRRARNINQRVDELAKEVAAVAERSTSTAARTVQMDGKLDRMLERLASL